MARKKTPIAPEDAGALLERLAALEERVRRLEAERPGQIQAGTAAAEVRPVPAGPAPARKEEISEDTIAIIAAAVAAFFGLRVRVRHVRLLGSEAWAQQGRVSIMTARHLAIRRG